MLPDLVIKRVIYTPEEVVGYMPVRSKIFWTIEKPWKNNIPFLSCIPCGLYECTPHVSPRHGRVIKLKNVPKRTHILFHVGNTSDDITGCIAGGYRLGRLNNKIAVLDSRKAFTLLMEEYGDRDFTLLITSYPHREQWV